MEGNTIKYNVYYHHEGNHMKTLQQEEPAHWNKSAFKFYHQSFDQTEVFLVAIYLGHQRKCTTALIPVCCTFFSLFDCSKLMPSC